MSIKMTKAQKSLSYRAYLSVKDALVSIANYQPDATAKANGACASLTALVKSMHGVDENPTSLWSNLLIRLVSYKTRKDDNHKWVKFNGISSFNKWVVEYKPESTLDVESNAGKNPDEQKAKKASTSEKKEAAIDVLKALPHDELMSIIASLTGVGSLTHVPHKEQENVGVLTHVPHEN